MVCQLVLYIVHLFRLEQVYNNYQCQFALAGCGNTPDAHMCHRGSNHTSKGLQRAKFDRHDSRGGSHCASSGGSAEPSHPSSACGGNSKSSLQSVPSQAPDDSASALGQYRQHHTR